jgi:hypothetical protein
MWDFFWRVPQSLNDLYKGLVYGKFWKRVWQ